MASTTTSNKIKKKTKKIPNSTVSTMPEDHEFGPATNFTAGVEQQNPFHNEVMREVKDLTAQNAEVLQHSQEMAKQHSNAMAILAKTLQRIEGFEQKIDRQDSDAMVILAKTLQRIEDLERKIDLQDIIIKRQQTSIDALTNKITTLQPAIPTRPTSSPAAPPNSYAAVASSFPPSPPPTRSPTPRNDFTCTIDLRQMNEVEKTPLKIRQGIELEVQKELGTVWKCAAVLRDRPDRLRIVCNTKEELENVKKATISIPRAKIAPDPLYPIKIDNVRTSSVLHPDGTLKEEIKETLSNENNTEIARLGWLSAKQTGKAFGSMVVYLTKSSEAQRILQKGYFDIGGESAYARYFERHPPKCFSCQREGHIARNCTEPVARSGKMDITN